MEIALEIADFSYAYPGTGRPVLDRVGLRIEPGECHCVCGPTGSGKSTLGLAAKGLLPCGRQSGRVTAPASPAPGRSGVGLVLQNPETQLLGATVGEEVAFGLENHGVAPGLMTARVTRALEAVGLVLPLARPSHGLSLGQKYRLLLAAQLVLEPALLVLDEPAAQLDPPGIAQVRTLIARLKRAGTAVLLLEHDPAALDGVVDIHWRLDDRGGLSRAAAPCPAPQSSAVGPAAPAPAALVLSATELGVGGEPPSLWQAISFALHPGERVLLHGPNGAGKSTLLRCLTGFVRPNTGSVRVFGKPPARDGHRLGYLFQNPDAQLFETTVFDEVAFSLKRRRVPGPERRRRVEGTLARCGIAHLAARSPHALSYGEKHLVALASVLAPEPELLLLDDPFAGLDPQRGAAIAGLLAGLAEERGTAILWTGHHARLPGDWAHRRMHLEGGRLAIH